jgi:hypothetical protein
MDVSVRIRRLARALVLALLVVVTASAGSVAKGVTAMAGPSFVGRETTRPWTAPQVRRRPIHRPAPVGRAPVDLRAKSVGAPVGAAGRSSPSRPVPAAASVTVFNGMNEVNGGTYPPDTQLAAVGTHVYEGVNQAYRIMTNAGATLQTMNFRTFFGSTGFVYDPRVFYDRTGSFPRVYMMALEMDGTSDANGVAKIWLAVSRSPQPTSLNASNWCRYGINAKFQAGTSNSSWVDFAGIGFGTNSIAISGNQYRWPSAGEAFTFDVIRTYRKNVVANNAAACPSITASNFRGSATAGDGNAFTITPTDHYTAPSSFTGQSNPIYFVNNESQPTNVYRVWRIANLTSANPSFTFVRVGGNFTFSLPHDSPQPGGGTTYRLATGFDQILQVAGLGNQLTSVQGTGCQFTGGTATESCVRVVRFNVGQNTSGQMTASIGRQDTFGGGDNVFFYHPSVAVNNAGTTGVAYQYSASNFYLSTGYALRTSSASAFTIGGLAGGTCTDTADYQASPEWNKVRTGDYTGAQTDPDDQTSFWFAGERANTINGTCQWQTVIGSVTP